MWMGLALHASFGRGAWNDSRSQHIASPTKTYFEVRSLAYSTATVAKYFPLMGPEITVGDELVGLGEGSTTDVGHLENFCYSCDYF